jgi:hypothetical protein
MIRIPQSQLIEWYLRAKLMGVPTVCLAHYDRHTLAKHEFLSTADLGRYVVQAPSTSVTSDSRPQGRIVAEDQEEYREGEIHWPYPLLAQAFRTLTSLKTFCQNEIDDWEFKGKKGVYDRVWHVSVEPTSSTHHSQPAPESPEGVGKGRTGTTPVITITEVSKPDYEQASGVPRRERIGVVNKELSIQMRRRKP